MKKIATYNNKGGVGKSTISANIAHGISKLGFKTLLIDSDGQENSSMFLGLILDEDDKNFYDLLTGNATIEEVSYNVRENLDIIVTPRDKIKKVERYIGLEKRPEKLFNYKTLKDLESVGYDYVIFDCGPGKGDLNDAILCYVDNIIVPVQLQAASVKGIPAVWEYLDELYLEPSIVKMVIPNMYNAVTKDSSDNLNILKETFKEDLLTEPVALRTKISESGKHGKTVFEIDNDEVANQIFKILERLVKVVG